MGSARARRRRGGAVTAASLLLVAGLASLVSPAAAVAVAAPVSGTITTVAGGTGEGPALTIAIRPEELAAQGPLVFITDAERHAVRVLDTRTGELRTVAGNGDPNPWAHQTPRADGGPATEDRLDQPSGVAVDAGGRVYLSDYNDNRVRRVDGSGVITTFAGGGSPPDNVGDGLPAVQAVIAGPTSLAFDPSGNLFVADLFAFKIRKISAAGIISTVAGKYCACTEPPRENVPATEASISPRALATDAAGRLYIADEDRVSMIDDAGVLRRVAGGGSPADARGDGGPAVAARLSRAEALAFDASGNLFIADNVDNRIRKVDTAGIITTVAGGGAAPDGLGDGALATNAVLANPNGVVVGAGGGLFVSDTGHLRLRRVLDGVITTVAGNGLGAFGGDGGPATKAQFSYPTGLVRDAAGNTFVADTGNHAVRKIDGSGRVTTVAGTGQWGFSGDGGPATAAQLREPTSVAVDAAGNVFIADTENGRIRKVDTAGIITTMAGGGTAALGEGGPATAVVLERPGALVFDAAGNLYLTDQLSSRVRRINAGGTISTFAGGGTPTRPGDVGDGGPATSATLDLRRGSTLAFDGFGQLHISDAAAGRVRKIDVTGVMSTVAGAGPSGVETLHDYAGKIATTLNLWAPGAIAFDANGSLYLVGGLYPKILRIDLMGRVRMVGGTGDIYSGLGDGGPATKARIGAAGLAFDAAGNLYVADAGADRIRRIATPTVVTRVASTGWNGLSQLGDGTTTDRSRVVTAPGLSNVKAVGAGYYHTLAIRADGSVWAWGWNRFGQLGDGTTTDRAVPTRINGLTNVVAVAGGAYNSLALQADGTVWAWGWNGLGEVGDGTTAERHVPVKVAGLSGVTAIAAGGYHNLALTRDGTVWAWGWNGFGQLGTGSSAALETRPVRVTGSAGAISIAAGAVHSLSVRVNGVSHEVWAWGWNALGQLGDGSTTDRSTPVKTLAFGDRVFAGGYHSFVGADTLGSAWGYNAFGQLGTGSTAAIVPMPARVMLPVTTDSVAAGLYHNIALGVDGSVMTWGWNGYGALGDGSLDVRRLPAVVPGIAGLGAVAAGSVHSVVVQ